MKVQWLTNDHKMLGELPEQFQEKISRQHLGPQVSGMDSLG